MKYAKIKTNNNSNITTLEVNIDRHLCTFDVKGIKENKEFWFDFHSINVDIRLWFDDELNPNLEIYPYNPIFVKDRFKKGGYSVVESIPVWFEKFEIRLKKDHLSRFDATQLYYLVKTIDEDSFRKTVNIDVLINGAFLCRFSEYFEAEVLSFLGKRQMSFQMLKVILKETKKQFRDEFIDFYDERFSL